MTASRRMCTRKTSPTRDKKTVLASAGPQLFEDPDMNNNYLIDKVIHYYRDNVSESPGPWGDRGCLCCFRYGRWVWKRHKCNFYNKQQPTRFRCETILLQGKTTIYDASSWTHFSDDYPCEAVAFSWHACSPRDKLSKLSAAHGYPSVTANCKRYSSKSSCFYVFTTYRLHVRTNLFFHHITMPKKPSRRHVIMSSCHHVIMPLRISGHKASALWDLAWGTDWLCWETTWGRAKAIRKSGWNNHPRVRSIRRFFRF